MIASPSSNPVISPFVFTLTMVSSDESYVSVSFAISSLIDKGRLTVSPSFNVRVSSVNVSVLSSVVQAAKTPSKPIKIHSFKYRIT